MICRTDFGEMIRTETLVPAITKFRTMFPYGGRMVGTMTPKKLANDDAGEARINAEENIGPLVAFSRPPPIPPFLGPLVALSLLQSWSKRDSNDD
ncbi:uncharacterized protein LOC132030577 [Lycium ferocissimum]|uniref:uncharacterized protein LOC132030577 n=1 Tax=Lycium ferocissimum TaxID=112874 RepID=UPI002815E332|nr:uncharacterized protein LOC132030577 [Lycium ferocissimum]